MKIKEIWGNFTSVQPQLISPGGFQPMRFHLGSKMRLLFLKCWQSHLWKTIMALKQKRVSGYNANSPRILDLAHYGGKIP